MQLITTTKPLLAGVMLLVATHAHATLTNYTASGQEVVYSSVSNVTWTKDANLLGSMFASQGFNTVVNAIIAANPTINTPHYANPSGIYTLSDNDFVDNGRVTWFGALAFVNYLNKISYAGNNQWRLPSVIVETEGVIRGNNIAFGNEYFELFYEELNGATGNNIPDSVFFDNEQMRGYWTGKEHNLNPNTAWMFYSQLGEQNNRGKQLQGFVWAITQGQITSVPEPDSLAMLLLGLGVMGNVVRRRRG